MVLKKLFPLLLVLMTVMSTMLALPVLADTGFGYAPNQFKAGYQYGNGVYFAPHHIKIYESPNEASALIDELYWTTNEGDDATLTVASKTQNRYLTASKVFLSFYPRLEIAMLAVIGDQGAVADDANSPVTWVEVVYDQATKKSGWVRLKDAEEQKTADLTKTEASHVGVYQTWLDFMKLNARAHGIYWLSGVSSYHRSIRMKDSDDSPLLQLTAIKEIKVKHIRGNWLLVEAQDMMDHTTPIGWLRWRDSDGNILVFPNIAHEKQPIITTMF